MRKQISAICTAMVILTTTCAYAATQYQFDRLGLLPGDGRSSAGSINNSGFVVGTSIEYGANDARGAFLWSKNTGMIDLQATSGLDFPGSINNNGLVVGTVSNGLEPQYAVMRGTNGQLTRLSNLSGAIDSAAAAINDSGWIVGTSGNYAVIWQGNTTAQMIGGASSSYSYAMDINNNATVAWIESLYDANHQWLGTRSYVWNQGANTLLQSLNTADDCQAEALNDSGTIVGTSGNHAVVWDSYGNIVLDLGIGAAYGINLSGQIVGTSGDHAVLWNPNGSIAADLGVSAEAYDINDSGQIVGSAVYDQYGSREAVLWQPVPEPSNIIALFCGIGGFAGYAIRRRVK